MNPGLPQKPEQYNTRQIGCQERTNQRVPLRRLPLPFLHQFFNRHIINVEAEVARAGRLIESKLGAETFQPFHAHRHHLVALIDSGADGTYTTLLVDQRKQIGTADLRLAVQPRDMILILEPHIQGLP